MHLEFCSFLQCCRYLSKGSFYVKYYLKTPRVPVGRTKYLHVYLYHHKVLEVLPVLLEEENSRDVK